MTIKLCCSQHKGGAGKTSFCANFAGCLAKFFNQKVLLIDCDNSANLTLGIAHDEEPVENFVDAIIENCENEYYPDPWDLVVQTKFENIDLIPTGLETLIKANKALEEGDFDVNHVFEALLEPLEEEYQWIIIDCPGNNVNPKIMNNIMTFSEYVVVPFEPSTDSANGYRLVKKKVRSIARDNPKLKIIGSFMNKYQKSTKLSKETFNIYQENVTDEFIPVPIRQSIAVGNARVNQTPLAFFDETAPVTQDYKQLTEFIMNKIKEN